MLADRFGALEGETQVKVVLIDDHELFRTGVREFLETWPEVEVLGEATTARAGFPIIEAKRPDVVLMDLTMPGMDGVVATREVLRRVPTVRVIVLSAHAQACDVSDAMEAGAAGYVVKSDPPATLIQALQSVSRGARYLPESLACRRAALEPLDAGSGVLGVLSQREREIFRLAADCRTAREIARDLCVARKTVDAHFSHINRKLGLRDRAELVRLAASVGLVHSIRSSIVPPET